MDTDEHRFSANASNTLMAECGFTIQESHQRCRNRDRGLFHLCASVVKLNRSGLVEDEDENENEDEENDSYKASGVASNWATRANNRPAAPPSSTR
jgi:hypothetical protein